MEDVVRNRSGAPEGNAVEDMARSGLAAKSRSAGAVQCGGACPGGITDIIWKQRMYMLDKMKVINIEVI